MGACMGMGVCMGFVRGHGHCAWALCMGIVHGHCARACARASGSIRARAAGSNCARADTHGTRAPPCPRAARQTCRPYPAPPPRAAGTCRPPSPPPPPCPRWAPSAARTPAANPIEAPDERKLLGESARNSGGGCLWGWGGAAQEATGGGEGRATRSAVRPVGSSSAEPAEVGSTRLQRAPWRRQMCTRCRTHRTPAV
eukprot:2534059-Prymnesium_polylepis.3